MGISTHILDTAFGRPAANVPVALSLLTGGTWTPLNEAATDSDGRCKNLLPESQNLQSGMYRIRFETAEYYRRNDLVGLYPYVEIVFTVSSADQHYHIPLLLTANGYTTYRGS
jgi:5-hydroxyisourate hydrolase